MLDESQFHVTADAALNHYYDQLEPAFESGTLEELELTSGILNIATPCGKAWVLSKHAPSRQLWLASPISGGLHFYYEATQWRLADGRTLENIVLSELRALKVTV